MTPENFVFWLNGFLELTEQEQIGNNQMRIIKDHIALVLKKETPTYTKGGFVPPIPPATSWPVYQPNDRLTCRSSVGEIKYLDTPVSC